MFPLTAHSVHIDSKLPKHPQAVIQCGRIKVAIWVAATEVGLFSRVSLWKLHDEPADWRLADTFDSTELLNAAKALREAHLWIFASEKQRKDEEHAS